MPITAPIEKYVDAIRQARALRTNFPAIFGSTLAVASGIISPINKYSPTAVNATATLTATQVAGGYVTSTSAAATTLTMPTGTLLGAALGATQGTEFEFYIDNTAGANTVTLAVATNGILSAVAVANSASFGLLTVPAGVTGTAQFTLVFSSATAYTFARTA
jgi:hypothetical protein